MEGHIDFLRSRVRDPSDFPHEIGLFLGYPPCDVAGFIDNGGRNFKYAGQWKVYGGVENTLRNFERYKKCRSVYLKMYDKGRSIKQLAVAA